MALINCPDCGTEVSTKANQCPKCARVFKEPEKEGCFNSDRCLLLHI